MRNLARVSPFLLLFALIGCSATPTPRQVSPCSTDPGGSACQLERYQNAASIGACPALPRGLV